MRGTATNRVGGSLRAMAIDAGRVDLAPRLTAQTVQSSLPEYPHPRPKSRETRPFLSSKWLPADARKKPRICESGHASFAVPPGRINENWEFLTFFPRTAIITLLCWKPPRPLRQPVRPTQCDKWSCRLVTVDVEWNSRILTHGSQRCLLLRHWTAKNRCGKQ